MGLHLSDLSFKNTSLTDESAKLLLDLLIDAGGHNKKTKSDVKDWSCRKLNLDLC